MVAVGPTEWISVAPEGDLTASRDLQRQLSTLGSAGVSTVMVDLRAVPELSSGLVAALVYGYRRLSSHRARLVVLADGYPCSSASPSRASTTSWRSPSTPTTQPSMAPLPRTICNR